MHLAGYIKHHLATFPSKDVVWNYEDGCVLAGSILLYQITHEDFYKEFVSHYMEEFVADDGKIKTYDIEEYNIDSLNTGKALIFLYEETQNEKYKKAIELLRYQLETHPRTKCGNFWHKKIYPNQIWLDGLYMAQPFYAACEKRFGSKDKYADILQQFINVRKLMFNEEKSLYYHAFDESREQPWADKKTGLSKNFWLRAEGWYLIALIDTIDEMEVPESQAAKTLSEIFIEAIKGILKYQDKKSKLFYQVIDKPEIDGNYLETSGSAMISYAVMKGCRLKVLDMDQYFHIGEEILMNIQDQKLVKVNDSFVLKDICKVAGLGPGAVRDGSVEYYLSEPIAEDDHKGTGAFIMAYAELMQKERAESV